MTTTMTTTTTSTTKKRHAPTSSAGVYDVIETGPVVSASGPELRRPMHLPISVPTLSNPSSRSQSLRPTVQTRPAGHQSGHETLEPRITRDSSYTPSLEASASRSPGSGPSSISSAQARRPQVPLPVQETSSHDFIDLNAMMFPSADPFAYPNHPMTILESQQQQPSQEPPNEAPPNRTTLMSNPVDDDPSYDQLEVQLYSPLSPYLTQAPSTTVPLAVDRAAPGELTDEFLALYGPSADMVARVQPGFCLDDVLGKGSAWEDSHILYGQRSPNGAEY